MIIAFLLVAFILYLIFPSRTPKTSEHLFRSHYAHRGLHNIKVNIPENTWKAFEASIESGYGFELDIQITKDKKAIVFHDDDFIRSSKLSKRVDELELSEIRDIKLFGTDEGVMELEELLAKVNGRVPLIIELKTTKHYLELCEEVARCLDSYNGDFSIESFNPSIVKWFRINRPRVIRGQLSAGMKAFEKLPLYQRVLLSFCLINFMGRPHFISYDHRSGSKLLLRFQKLLGAKLVAWTVDNDDAFRITSKYFDTLIFEKIKV